MAPQENLYEVEQMLNQPGTYFNPQTEVMVVVDDSPSLDTEIFNLEAYEGADWVRISDEVPVDEDGRDEALERFQTHYHAGAAGSVSATALEQGDEELDEGDLDLLALSAREGRIDSAVYPDALGRAWSALPCHTSGELLASASPGFEFLDCPIEYNIAGEPDPADVWVEVTAQEPEPGRRLPAARLDEVAARERVDADPSGDRRPRLVDHVLQDDVGCPAAEERTDVREREDPASHGRYTDESR